MQVIQGIQAFDACWQALKQAYPISQAERILLVQSMGQFVDAYGTQAEIRASLPRPLQILFDRLVDAYLNGYVPDQIKPVDLSPSADLRQAATVLVSASPRVTATTLARAERQQQSSEPSLVNEAETFVLDRHRP